MLEDLRDDKNNEEIRDDEESLDCDQTGVHLV